MDLNRVTTSDIARWKEAEEVFAEYDMKLSKATQRLTKVREQISSLLADVSQANKKKDEVSRFGLPQLFAKLSGTYDTEVEAVNEVAVSTTQQILDLQGELKAANDDYQKNKEICDKYRNDSDRYKGIKELLIRRYKQESEGNFRFIADTNELIEQKTIERQKLNRVITTSEKVIQSAQFAYKCIRERESYHTQLSQSLDFKGQFVPMYSCDMELNEGIYALSDLFTAIQETMTEGGKIPLSEFYEKYGQEMNRLLYHSFDLFDAPEVPKMISEADKMAMDLKENVEQLCTDYKLKLEICDREINEARDTLDKLYSGLVEAYVEKLKQNEQSVS